ncbi:hypothetical protein [Streptosporangium sp. NPDC051022]|uniref:hypothetical protein n=1 Tax=Streptosporangium sp. NPDC051022 TaxID=3155752 RepID=UPI00343220B4
MDAVGMRRQISELRGALQRQGATRRQIAVVIAERFRLNPRVAFRHAAGLTQSEVADLYNRHWPSESPKTFKNISYWECWQGANASGASSSSRAPSYQDLTRLADLYGCSVDDLLRGPCPPQPAALSTLPLSDVLSMSKGDGYPEKADGDDVVIAVSVPTGEGAITVTLSRRQFTHLLAAAGLTAMLPETALASESLPEGAVRSTAGLSGADYRQLLAAHQTGHHLLDPSTHIASLHRTLRDIDRVREGAGTATRRDLRQIQGEYAEHLSWLYRECGDLASCHTWADRATAWALESGDTTMAAYIMVRKAAFALDAGDSTTAVELADAVRTASWTVPPVLYGVAKAYEARGHALNGTVAAAQLDEAAELIAGGRSEGDPAYLRFFTTDFADVQRATCYVDAGLPERAVTILQSRITSLPRSHHRDRAVHLARLGAAHAADRVPDAAAFAGLGALSEARRASSEHVLAELARLDTVLTTRWPTQPQVRRFHEALTEAPAV